MEDEDGKGHFWGFNWLALGLYKKNLYCVFMELSIY
jgi:hypothetical protein